MSSQATVEELRAARPDLVQPFLAALRGARSTVLSRLWGTFAREPLPEIVQRRRCGDALVVTVADGGRLIGPANHDRQRHHPTPRPTRDARSSAVPLSPRPTRWHPLGRLSENRLDRPDHGDSLQPDLQRHALHAVRTRRHRFGPGTHPPPTLPGRLAVPGCPWRWSRRQITPEATQQAITWATTAVPALGVHAFIRTSSPTVTTVTSTRSATTAREHAMNHMAARKRKLLPRTGGRPSLIGDAEERYDR
jgi:hypothetical protein